MKGIAERGGKAGARREANGCREGNVYRFMGTEMMLLNAEWRREADLCTPIC